MTDEIADEEELQALLDEYEEDGALAYDGKHGKVWQWDKRDSRDAAMACTIRVQERIGADGQVEQRFRVHYDDGTYQDEWTLWYWASAPWSIKRH